MNDETKACLKTLGTVVLWIVAALIVATMAYYVGAFRSVATGFFWYDVRRLLHFTYESVIVPCCLFYVGVVLTGLFKSWLFPTKKEESISVSVTELQEQCVSLDRRMDQVENKEHNLIIRLQNLEAKMQVICSILSLNKSEELQQSANDVLKDCAR